MEVDTINVVKLPNKALQRKAQNSLPYKLIERNLGEALRHWGQLLRDTAERHEIFPHSRTYRWSNVDITETLTTDLLTYFVHELEPDIAPEIGKLLMEGRVNMVLVLSYREFPTQEDWCQHFKIPWSNKFMRSPQGIITGEAKGGESFAPLIQLHEMRAFTGKTLGKVLDTVEERKKKYDFDWN